MDTRECLGFKLPLWLCSLVDKTVGRIFDSGVGNGRSSRGKAIVRFGIGNRSAAAQAEQRRRRGREGDGGPFILDENAVQYVRFHGFQRAASKTNVARDE